jgi:formate dehydrogenase maturation protein FdhE
MPSASVVVVGRTQQGLLLRCRVCGAELEATCDDCVRNFTSEHAHTHLGLGDVVASGIKRLFGIKPCPACERRKAALNRAVPRAMRRR